MKIIYILDQLFKAGTQNHVCQVATRLHKLGHDIMVICLEEKGVQAEDLESIGIPVIALHTKAIYHPTSLIKQWQLIGILKREKPDVVQTFLLKANLMGVIAAKVAKVPTILSTRRSLGYDFKKRHYMLLNLVTPFTSAILTNSEAIREVTIEKEKVEKEKVMTIYNGIDPDRFRIPVNESIKKKLNIPLNAPVIGIVANIRPVKGMEYLLIAMAKVVRYHRNARLIVVGNPQRNSNYFQDLQYLLEQLQIRENVIFLENCRRIPEVLSIFDLAILSSISEGFSNTVLEYMSAKKTIIATRVGGNKEAITEGISGILVEPKDPCEMADQIVRLLEEKEYAKLLAINAGERVRRKFSFNGMIQEYLRTYRSFHTVSRFQNSENQAKGVS